MTTEITPNTSPSRDPAHDGASDEGREGPVREKLEETRIDELKRQSLEYPAADMKQVPGSVDDRGRIRKKRSLDDMEEGESKSDAKHTRKRSRELDEKDRPSKKEKAEADDVEKATTTAADPAEAVEQHHAKVTAEDKPSTTNTTGTEPVPPTTPPKIASTSGFANASAKSPFASLNSAKSPFAAASNSAPNGVSTTGFSSFAQSSASPFKSLSPTKAAEPTTTADQDKATSIEAPKEKLSFGSAGNQPSGFGALGGQKKSVFGSALGSSSPFANAASTGSASPLKTFASSTNGTNGLSGSKAAKIGEAAEDEEEENDGSGDEASEMVGTQQEEKRDERFYQQDVETGEEGERTIFQRRAKIYYKPGDSWKERGVGVFKLNCKKVKVPSNAKATGTDGDKEADIEACEPVDQKVAARFILRADGTNRTMLNSPFLKSVTFTDRPGTEGGKSKIFTGYIDGKPIPCLIQMKLPSDVQELVECIEEMRPTL